MTTLTQHQQMKHTYSSFESCGHLNTVWSHGEAKQCVVISALKENVSTWKNGQNEGEICVPVVTNLNRHTNKSAKVRQHT